MIYLLMTIAFILLQAFYSGIETGLVSLQRPRVKNGIKEGHRTAFILEFFLENPEYMLSTTLLGTNICVVCTSLMAKQTAAAFGFASPAGIMGTGLILTVILLAVEIIPKDWFRQAPYERCTKFALLLYASWFVLYVPVKILAGFTRFTAKIFSGEKHPQSASLELMREDFRLLLRESEADGIIDEEAADLLDRSIDFFKLRVEDIKIPKEKVKSISAKSSIREALDFCRKHRVSRVPVYLENKEKQNWIGFFSVYDAIFSVSEKKWDSIRVLNCLRPLRTVEASAGINNVLTKSKLSSVPLLVVCAQDDPEQQLGIVTPLDVVKVCFK
jgi:CBS domain containing-hemolysin-like protein